MDYDAYVAMWDERDKFACSSHEERMNLLGHLLSEQMPTLDDDETLSSWNEYTEDESWTGTL